MSNESEDDYVPRLMKASARCDERDTRSRFQSLHFRETPQYNSVRGSNADDKASRKVSKYMSIFSYLALLGVTSFFNFAAIARRCYSKSSLVREVKFYVPL